MTELYVPRVLVLAGRRAGTLDPLAEGAGVSHKCLAPVAGQAMIGRVLTTVQKTFPEAVIYVSIESCDELSKEPTVRRLADTGRLKWVEAKDNLLESVAHASDFAGFPILVTTADNVLVTPDALKALAHAGSSGYADAIAVFTYKEAIEAAHSGGKNRYYKFKDGSFSNCNLFWLDNHRSLKAAKAFRHGGQFLKVPGRIIKTFGLLNLIRFKLGTHTLKGAMRLVSSRMGANIQPLVLPDGKLAIDVDDTKSLQMAEKIIGEMETRSGAQH